VHARGEHPDLLCRGECGIHIKLAATKCCYISDGPIPPVLRALDEGGDVGDQ
jgi:hypothetical protein